MAKRRYDELSPVTRRRVVTAWLLRSAASVTVLLVVYYLAPLDEPFGALTWIELAIGLLAFGVVMVWQIRAVLASDVPRLRAVQALAVGLPLLLLVFASTYVLIARSVPGSFTEPISRTDALYFTVTVFSTVGFGDIAPRSEAARVATMIQMVVNLVVVGLVAKILLDAVQMAVRRRDTAVPESGADKDGDGPTTDL